MVDVLMASPQARHFLGPERAARVLFGPRSRPYVTVIVLIGAAALFCCALSGCALPRGRSFNELDYPIATKTVEVDGIQIAYSDRGEGEPTLILIHGLGSYSPVWSRNMDELSCCARVIAIDLPGYGRSSKANYLYSMKFFARVVERFIEKLELGRVVLVGHSMGGQIALTHALRYPGRAEALVLVAPAGLERFGAGEGAWLSEAMSKEFVELTPPENVHTNFQSNFYDMPKAAAFMARHRLQIINGPDFDGYAYAVSRSVRAMITEPVADRLGDVRVPTLVLFGREDSLIPNPMLHGGTPAPIAREAVARMPRARLVVIPRAGHMVQFERPEAFDRAVLDFVSTLDKEETP
jgi:pimeloyl-ACP methyl ester carboxylesterase